ncbi:MAG: hypothetical protein IJI41_11435 [Anaerolineaceae bacterium]|nr:hypothetical protein [Anaerolineaceae bacterium]
MRNTWDHLALVLYTAGIILVCLIFAFANRRDEIIPDYSAAPAESTAMPAATAAAPSIPNEPSFHRPVRSVSHEYVFDGMSAEALPASEGMLSIRDLTSSVFYNEPSGEYQHVFHEETGVYDCYVYGTGTIGDLDGYAKYVFRYDSRTGKAASFIQEQHFDTGKDLGTDDLSVYAANTGSLLEAVFSGTDVPLAADKRKIEELALYFFSSWIPQHPSVPAAVHFRLPSYFLTFVMDRDVFITMISPEKIPTGYAVENETD